MKSIIAVSLVAVTVTACGKETKTRVVEKPVDKIVTVSVPTKDLEQERQIAELLADVYAQRAEIEAYEAQIAAINAQIEEYIAAIEAGDDEFQEVSAQLAEAQRQADLLQRFLRAAASNEQELVACIEALESRPDEQCIVTTYPAGG